MTETEIVPISKDYYENWMPVKSSAQWVSYLKNWKNASCLYWRDHVSYSGTSWAVLSCDSTGKKIRLWGRALNSNLRSLEFCLVNVMGRWKWRNRWEVFIGLLWNAELEELGWAAGEARDGRRLSLSPQPEIHLSLSWNTNGFLWSPGPTLLCI